MVVDSEEEGELHVAEDLIEEGVGSVGAVVVVVKDSNLFCIFSIETILLLGVESYYFSSSFRNNRMERRQDEKKLSSNLLT